MLYPGGCKRSRIRHHFPCWCHFGISPNLLTYGLPLPVIRLVDQPLAVPITHYASGSAFTSVDCMFLAADLSG